MLRRSVQRLASVLMTSREARWVTFFSALTISGGLLSNRLLTQLVAPRPLGELYLIMNLALWVTIPMASSFVYVQRHWAVARNAGRLGEFVRAIWRGLFAQAALGAIVAIVLRVAHLGLSSWKAAVCFWVVCAGQSVVQLIAQTFALERRRVLSGILDLLGTPARQVGLGLLAASFAWATGEELLIGQALYFLIISLVIVSLFVRMLRSIPAAPRVSSTHAEGQLSRRGFLAFVLPFLVTAIATQISGSAERWGLALTADPGATAIFVQAVGLSTAAVGAATGFVTAYYQPVITDALALAPTAPLSAGRTAIRRYVVLVATMLAGLSTVFWFGARPLTAFFFGSRFTQVAELLPWTMLGASLFGAGQALFMVPYAVRDAFWPAVIKVLCLVGYAVLLVRLSSLVVGDAARGYARIYAGAQAAYAALMMALAVIHVARARRGLQMATSG